MGIISVAFGWMTPVVMIVVPRESRGTEAGFLRNCLMVFNALCLRPATDDGRVHGHGRGHHPVRVDHRGAGLLLGSRPHAVCSRSALPYGR